MKSLEEQIAELTAEYNFKSEMQTILGQYKHLAYKSAWKDYDNTITIQLKEDTFIGTAGEHLLNIVNILPATETQTRIGERTNNDTIHFSPFNMHWCNNVNDNYVRISYLSNRTYVRVEMPLDFYSKVSRREMRNITDSEDHYFTGYSRKEIQNIRLPRYSSLYFDQLSWYGGENDTIIKDAEYREQFERMVFTGEQPLG